MLANRYKPSRDWSSAFLEQLQRQYSQLARSQSNKLLLALPDLGITAPPALAAQLSQRIIAGVPSFSSGQQLVDALLAATKGGTRPQEQWLRLVAEELRDHMHDMDLQALSDSWWCFGMLGFEPGADWVQLFGGAVLRAAPRGSATAAAQLIIDSARPSATAGRRLRGVPGGGPVLQVLLRRIVPASGPALNASSGPALNASSAPTAGSAVTPMPGVRLGSEEGPVSQPVAANRPRFVADGASLPVSIVNASRRAQADEQWKPSGGLHSLDGSQALLLADALVRLGFGSPDQVMAMLGGAARRQAPFPM